jgi:hypothetical protein
VLPAAYDCTGNAAAYNRSKMKVSAMLRTISIARVGADAQLRGECEVIVLFRSCSADNLNWSSDE